jgi:N-carbamoylputrescine amidase
LMPAAGLGSSKREKGNTPVQHQSGRVTACGDRSFTLQDIRIALGVVNCQVAAVEENLAQVDRMAGEAAGEGARIVCFPELTLTGYSVAPEVTQTALPVPGPETEEVVRIARSTDMTILVGMAEKDDSGRIFATHLVVTPRGVAERYRKIHIAPPERRLFSSGGRVAVLCLPWLTIGLQLCYDSHFPELSTCMALKGCDLIFIPHASPRGTPEEKTTSWMRHLAARAFDNGVFVAACNQVGDNRQGLGFPGVAVVIGPAGQVLEHFGGNREKLLLADLKADLLTAVRGHRMRYFLPHRRPDIYATCLMGRGESLQENGR